MLHVSEHSPRVTSLSLTLFCCFPLPLLRTLWFHWTYPENPGRSSYLNIIVVVVQLLGWVQLFATPWTAAHQASLSFTISQSLLKFISIESVMPSSHLILCRPLLLPSSFLSMRVFTNELAIHIRWPKCWRFSFCISPSSEYSGLISFKIDWFDLLAVQGTLKTLKISNVNSTCNLNSLPGNVAYSQILGTMTSLGEPPSCLSKRVFYISNIYIIYIY